MCRRISSTSPLLNLAVNKPRAVAPGLWPVTVHWIRDSENGPQGRGYRSKQWTLAAASASTTSIGREALWGRSLALAAELL